MREKLAAILEITGAFITGVVVARFLGRLLGVPTASLRTLQEGTAPDYLALAWTSAASLLLRYGIILGLAFAIGWWSKRRRLAEYGVRSLSLRHTLAIAIVLFSTGGLLPRIVLILKDRIPMGEQPRHWELLSAPQSFEFWVYMAVASFGLVPIVEELFFRGYVQTRLSEGFGAAAAIVMTAIVFTLSHRQYFLASGVGAGMLVSLLVGALLASYTRERFGTLIPGIVAHALGNLPIRGAAQFVVLALMIIVIVIARRPIAEHARELGRTIASRSVLSGLAIAIVVVAAVLAIAIAVPKALPWVGVAALLIAIGQRVWLRLTIVLTLLAFACGEKTWVEPHTGMRFVRVPAGEFTMGAPLDEPFRRDDEVPHRVRIPRPFFMSETEVTQRQWMAVMGANPSTFKAAGLDAPVESVTWHEVQEFVRRLNARSGERFRLPSEAEWEYACRAGSTTAYNSGPRLSTDEANYDGRYPLPGQAKGRFRESTTPVRSFAPNAWGLYDMHGNVWEWCADEYCAYPANRCGSRYKVIRGGSWYFGADSARSALRYTHEPHLRGFSIGFRLVREASDS